MSPTLKTELTEYAAQRGTTGPYADNLDVDVIVVGAGFAGVYLLYELRKAGLKTVVYEAGNDLGGTWRWNCYPGANVDSEVPEYELSIPEVYKTWNWPNNYPSYENLRDYFDHVDKVLDIKKDVAFNSVVVSAEFDTDVGKWTVKTSDGRTALSRFLVVAAGFASKRYVPDFKGLDKFKGIVHHSSFWPDEEVPVEGKRVGVIGTGASGVQIVQTWGPKAKDLTVFQRTPNLAIPMRKRELTVQEQERSKWFYSELFELREKCYGGFLYDMYHRNTFDDTPEEREEYYQKLWDDGGFRFWVKNYKDYLYDPKANREAYNFWRKQVLKRIDDPKDAAVLAPEEPPHPFGVKRPCLEYSYYEQFNRPSVHIADISKNPIKEFTEDGITLEDGTHYQLDIVAIATGFDITTGGMTSMGLKSIHGTTLQDEWKEAAHTYLGTTVSGYPNMFHLYGPHGPTLLSNGPTSIEVQGRWITDVIKKIARNGIKYIDPTPEASKAWKKHINDTAAETLFPTTRSTYMGGSVPGKAFEMTCYVLGVPQYKAEIRSVLPDLDGFNVVR